MNVKSMLVGFLIAVVASTGTYFLVPPPGGAYAGDCATPMEIDSIVMNVITDCNFSRGGADAEWYRPNCP